MRSKKVCNLYISDHYSQIIFAPNHQTKDGIYYEQEKCCGSEFLINNEELGQTILSCLSVFSIKDLDLTQFKQSDWPAYKHSRSKTIKDFKSCYRLISITGANEYNLVFNAEAFLNYTEEVSVKIVFSSNEQEKEIGKKIQELYQASNLIKDKK